MTTRQVTHQVEAFLVWMKTAKQYSLASVRSYRGALEHFAGWLHEAGVDDAKEVTHDLIERYQAALYETRTRRGDRRGERLSSSTQYRRLASISAWFKWLFRQNIVRPNPAAMIELPKVADQLPMKPFSLAEVEQILAQPNIGTPKGLRDRAILEVLFATGVRRAELMRVRVSDVDPGRRTLFVHKGKGDKQRVVPISERALYWVDKYVLTVRPLIPNASKTPVMFLSMPGKPMTDDVVTYAVGEYIRAANIGRKVGSCHLFRHTVATLMLERGADLRYVQELLGHASPTTTQVYTKVTITSLRNAYEKAHPLTAPPTTAAPS